MRYAFALLLLIGGCSGGASSRTDRAVTASGGEEALGAIQSFRTEARGEFLGLPYRSTTYYRRPSDWAMSVTGQRSFKGMVLGDKNRSYLAIGKHLMQEDGELQMGWIHLRDAYTTMFLPDRLNEPGVKVEKADSVRIGGEKRKAITATFPGGQPMTLVFDEDSKRLHRIYFSAQEPGTEDWHDWILEADGWTEVQGIQAPRATRLYTADRVEGTDEDDDARIEEVLASREVYETIEWNPKVADDVFKEPTNATRAQVNIKDVTPEMVGVLKVYGPFADVQHGVRDLLDWIEKKGGEVTGDVTLLYRDRPHPQHARTKTEVQIPVDLKRYASDSQVRVNTRQAFRMAYVTYEGPADGAYMMYGPVKAWCAKNGWRKSGPWRIRYIEFDEATEFCKAEIGYPVRPAR
ncbi:MAG: GyrI-like domain-containing protein [Planctomycetota bacterium]